MVLPYAFSFPTTHPHLSDNIPLAHALWLARYQLLCALVPLILGTFLGWRYSSFVVKGVRNGIWTEEQLEQARIWIESRPVTILQTAFILAFLAVLIAKIFDHHHGGSLSLSYTFIYALNPLSAMRRALRKPQTPTHPIDWGQLQPLHSDHWGHPPASV